MSRHLNFALGFFLWPLAAMAGPYAAINGSQAVTRVSDGATVPADPSNADWQAYQAWVKDGNSPDAAPTPPATPATFTLAQLTSLLTPAEQAAIYGSADAKVRIFLLTRAGTSFTMAQIKTGLDYLVAQKLLTADREAAILNASQPS